MSMRQNAWQLLRRILSSYVFLAGVGAILGIFIFGAYVGKPKVGVITVPSTVLDTRSVADITPLLRYAREQRDIKAVVMKLDSPGGTVISSEEFFYHMLATREEKPVVVAVDGIAASGGYYAAMGANYIYVKPTSFVGSVGALQFLPRSLPPPEELNFTGPAKLTGGTRRDFLNMLEEIKEAFAAVVLSQRGDRLLISKEELVSARIFSGSEAVRNGMVDAIGTEIDAIRKAAELAKLRRYAVVDVNAKVAQEAPDVGGQDTVVPGLPQRVYRTPQELLEDARFPYMYYLFLERP